MSGHSKWAGIRHHKALVDKKRSNLFTKFANDITVAARHGGGDPGFNPTLRASIDAARAGNMPKDNIERAIKRGTGELGGAVVEELLYEGFGPGNVAMLVAVLTDNRNRALADIRTIFTKNSGRFAEAGGVAYQFTQRGVIRAAVTPANESLFEEAVIEGGADDYQLGEGHAIVYTSVSHLHTLRSSLEAQGIKVDSAAVEYVANAPIEAPDSELEKIATLVEKFEDYDDVTAVYTNLAE